MDERLRALYRQFVSGDISASHYLNSIRRAGESLELLDISDRIEGLQFPLDEMGEPYCEVCEMNDDGRTKSFYTCSECGTPNCRVCVPPDRAELPPGREAVCEGCELDRAEGVIGGSFDGKIRLRIEFMEHLTEDYDGSVTFGGQDIPQAFELPLNSALFAHGRFGGTQPSIDDLLLEMSEAEIIQHGMACPIYRFGIVVSENYFVADGDQRGKTQEESVEFVIEYGPLQDINATADGADVETTHPAGTLVVDSTYNELNSVLLLTNLNGDVINEVLTRENYYEDLEDAVSDLLEVMNRWGKEVIWLPRWMWD